MTEFVSRNDTGRLGAPPSTSRWSHAQSVERGYWDSITPTVLFGILSSFSSFLDGLGERRLETLFGEKEVLELGVGPLGLSVTSLWPGKDRIQRLVKVEPLPRTSIADTPAGSATWAEPVIAWMDILSREGLQVQTAAEALDYQAEFDSVVTYNVLDHVDDPRLVIRKAFTALRPGGSIIVGVDCRSVLGKLRFDHIIRRTRRGTILVDAHPYTFRTADVVRLLEDAGFHKIECLNPPGPARSVIGGAFRATFVAVR